MSCPQVNSPHDDDVRFVFVAALVSGVRFDEVVLASPRPTRAPGIPPSCLRPGAHPYPPWRPPLRRHPNLHCHPNLRVAMVLFLTVPRSTLPPVTPRYQAEKPSARGRPSSDQEDEQPANQAGRCHAGARAPCWHHGCRAVPQASACTDNRAESLSSGSRGPTAPLTSPRKQRCKPCMRW